MSLKIEVPTQVTLPTDGGEAKHIFTEQNSVNGNPWVLWIEKGGECIILRSALLTDLQDGDYDDMEKIELTKEEFEALKKVPYNFKGKK